MHGPNPIPGQTRRLPNHRLIGAFQDWHWSNPLVPKDAPPHRDLLKVIEEAKYHGLEGKLAAEADKLIQELCCVSYW